MGAAGGRTGRGTDGPMDGLMDCWDGRAAGGQLGGGGSSRYAPLCSGPWRSRSSSFSAPPAPVSHSSPLWLAHPYLSWGPDEALGGRRGPH